MSDILNMLRFHIGDMLYAVRTHIHVRTYMLNRIIGLPRFIEVDCDKPWFIHIYPDVKWTSYLGVSLVLGLYFTVAIEVRRRRDKVSPYIPTTV